LISKHTPCCHRNKSCLQRSMPRRKRDNCGTFLWELSW